MVIARTINRPPDLLCDRNNLGDPCVLAVLEQIRGAGRGTELFFEPLRRKGREGFLWLVAPKIEAVRFAVQPIACGERDGEHRRYRGRWQVCKVIQVPLLVLEHTL